MTSKRLFFLPYMAILAVFFYSCGSPNKLKSMVYLADSVRQSQKITSNYEYLLQPGDRIQIMVTALNPVAAQAFNIMAPVATTVTSASMAEPSFSGNSASSGYLIDKEGAIQFPQMGTLLIKGLTTDSVSKLIQIRLLQFLKEPVVIVNISNFKVNILGEVTKPGTIIVPDGKITILQAISQCGDLTIFGRRENITVIREKDGRRTFGKLDLTSNSIFESPYYFLEQGDVVYVEMNKDKLLLNDATEARNFRIYSLILAAVSALSIIVTVFK